MGPQVDTGIAAAIAAIVMVAAIRKLQRPRVFTTTLLQLFPRLRRQGARRFAAPIAVGFALCELAVAVGVVALRGPAGLVAAGALVAIGCVFVGAVAQAVRVGASCSCFGGLGRTAAGGRELGRATAMVLASAVVLTGRIRDSGPTTRVGLTTAAAAAATLLAVLIAQRLGMAVRPGRQLETPAARTLGAALRNAVGVDSALYTKSRTGAVSQGRRLDGAELAQTVSVLRAAPATSTVVEALRALECHAPQWDRAQAARHGAVSNQPELDVISVPLETGCVLVAKLEPTNPPRVRHIIGCHHGQCTTVEAEDLSSR